ncbi:MAG: hypothetical protein ACWA6R_05255 [Nitrosomonas sp.]
MTQDNDISTQTTSSSSSSSISPIRITLQQSEQAGQPGYANFTSLSQGQGVVIVNFGFIDSQAIQILQHKIKSGEEQSGQITAHTSCRVALNSNAIQQLTQQLGQLLNPPVKAPAGLEQQNSTQPPQEQPSTIPPPEKTTETPSSSGGFGFPWSKK